MDAVCDFGVIRHFLPFQNLRLNERDLSADREHLGPHFLKNSHMIRNVIRSGIAIQKLAQRHNRGQCRRHRRRIEVRKPGDVGKVGVCKDDSGFVCLPQIVIKQAKHIHEPAGVLHDAPGQRSTLLCLIDCHLDSLRLQALI
jgi:hypothetical protein